MALDCRVPRYRVQQTERRGVRTVNRKWQVVNGEKRSAARETSAVFYVLGQDETARTMKSMKGLKVNPAALDTENRSSALLLRASSWHSSRLHVLHG